MTEQNSPMEASFSVLTMSIASSAAMALGLAPHPQNGQMSVDKPMAKFNIDLLLVLQEKSRNNLNEDEQRFLDAVVADLQGKYVAIK